MTANHTLKTILIFICATSFISCKNIDKNESFKIENDTIYKYFDDQKAMIAQKKWQLNDSTSYIMFYDQKGLLKSEGTVLYDSLKFGIWNLFTNESAENFKKVREYKIIKGKEYSNQEWVINTENDTVMGHFISHNPIKDEYMVGDTIEIQFYYPLPVISKNSELYLVHAKDGNFNKTFSNIDSLTLDTVSNVYRINKFKDNNLSQYKRAVYMNYILESTGEKNIRNIFHERFDTIYNDTSSTSFIDIYFDKEINVKDTIENMKDEISQK